MSPSDTFRSALDRMLSRRDPRVRIRAALKVSRHGARGCLKPILRRLEVECEPAVVAALLVALARLGTARHVALVSSWLTHRDHRVIRAAALALYALGGADALPLLIGLLGKGDERVVKQALVVLLRTDAGTLFAHVTMLLRSPWEPARATGRACRRWLAADEIRELAGLPAGALDRHHAELAAALVPRPPAPVVAPAVVAPPPNRYHAAGLRAFAGAAFAALVLVSSLAAPDRGAAGSVDPMARVELAAREAHAPAPVAPRARPAFADLTARVDAARQTALALRPRPFRLTADVVARRATERLRARGITAAPYVELFARAAVSDAAAMALLARVQAAEASGDLPVALALLDEALGGLHPNDLERRLQLTRQKRWLLEGHARWAEAHRALVAEAETDAAIAAILEATTDRAGQALARPGTAAAARERARRLAAMTQAEVLRRSPVLANRAAPSA